jgi:hypothetical protein
MMSGLAVVYNGRLGLLLSHGAKMTSFDKFTSLCTASEVVLSNSPAATAYRAQPATQYATLLRLPMAAIAGNVSDRSDVSSVAILGYN